MENENNMATATLPDFLKGEVLLMDKSLTWTSFDVVNKVRYMLKDKFSHKKIKVGHAGTLDPLATGLVILCTGKMTRQIDSIQAQQKEYIADVQFGATTPSHDLETEVDQTYETAHITAEMLQQALLDYTGTIEQVPPVYSAMRVNGKRAYMYARKGQEVEMKGREVQIYSIEMLSGFADFPAVKLRISCGKGTYIRSLAYDLGQMLGSGAHLTALRRTKIGNHSIADARTITEIEQWFDSIREKISLPDDHKA